MISYAFQMVLPLSSAIHAHIKIRICSFFWWRARPPPFEIPPPLPQQGNSYDSVENIGFEGVNDCAPQAREILGLWGS